MLGSWSCSGVITRSVNWGTPWTHTMCWSSSSDMSSILMGFNKQKPDIIQCCRLCVYIYIYLHYTHPTCTILVNELQKHNNRHSTIVTMVRIVIIILETWDTMRYIKISNGRIPTSFFPPPCCMLVPGGSISPSLPMRTNCNHAAWTEWWVLSFVLGQWKGFDQQKVGFSATKTIKYW